MGSSLGCFDDDDKDNDTVCYSLVGVTGVAMTLLFAAGLVLCCVCFRRRKTLLVLLVAMNKTLWLQVDTG